MTNLNNEVRELSLDEVDGVSGGSLLSALKALYNGIRDEFGNRLRRQCGQANRQYAGLAATVVK